MLKFIYHIFFLCFFLSIDVLHGKGPDSFPGTFIPDGENIFEGKEDPVKLEGVPFSLPECLLLGLQKNYDIQIIRNQEEIADNNATRGNAGYYPGIDLSGGYSGSLNEIKQHIDGGGSVNNHNINNGTLNAGVNVGWTLFNGFSIKTTYERLLELQKIGELNTRLTIEEFITALTSEYYNYIRQNIRLKNLHYAVTLSMERLRIVEAHYNIGSKSRLDLQQANVDLNSDRSRLMKQYETLHSVQTRLNQLMANQDIEFPIIAADSMIVYDAEIIKEDIENKMRYENTYLELARKDITISKLDLKLVESGRYPYLRLNGGYGYTHNWYGSGTYDRQRNLGLNYGVTVGVNIFDGKNQKRREKNARIETENKLLGYENTELALQKEFSDAWMSYRNNIRLTDLEQDNLATARENYEIAMERYRLGQLSGIELREAQTSLLEAEERLLEAQFDTKINEINLMGMSGQAVNYLN